MATKSIDKDKIIKELKQMRNEVPDTYADTSFNKKYRKNQHGVSVCVSNPINDLMKHLMALAHKNPKLKEILSDYMDLYDIYDKRNTLKYLQDEEAYVYKEVMNGDVSCYTLAGFTDALTDVLNNTDDDYFFIMLDDDNEDDAVYSLNIGTLRGILSNAIDTLEHND